MLGGKHVLHESSYSVGADIAQGPLLRALPYGAGVFNPVLRTLRSDVSAAMLRYHPLRVHFLVECTAQTC